MLPSLIGIIASSGGAAGGGTDFESIATVTVGSGGASTITFSSIPSTYQHLQIRGTQLGTNAYFRVRFNSDTGSNYAWHEIYGDGSSVSAGGGSSTTFAVIEASSTGTASRPGALVCDLLDYASTNKNKTIRSLCGYDDNGSGRIHFVSSLWNNSSTAINNIQLTISAGTIDQYSSFALYGIKG